MIEISLPLIGTLSHWRRYAKRLIYEKTPPEKVNWSITQDTVIETELQPAPAMFKLKVSERFIALSERAIWHSDPSRFSLLYDLLWRLRLSPKLASNDKDDTVARLLALEVAVESHIRQIHKKLRFETHAGRLVAEIAPRHPVLEAMGPKLAERYAAFDWTIRTPDITLVHTKGELRFSAVTDGVHRTKVKPKSSVTPFFPGFEDYTPTSGGSSTCTPLILHP